MRNFLFVFPLLALLTLFSACSRDAHVPSGRARKVSFRENGNAFSAKKARKSKPPQMGFYRKKERRNVFEAITYRVRYTFANKKEKRVIGNERRPASTKYNRKKQGESIGKMNSTFVKGKVKAKRGRNKQGDHTADSFAKKANKKKGFLFFGRKK